MKSFTATAFILLIAISAFPAGINLPGIGARAVSMGGAYRALSNDGSALYWNPAGLSSVDESQLTAVGQYMLTYSDFTADDTLRAINLLFREGPQKKLDREFYTGNIFGVYAPKGNSAWRFGFGVYSPAGVGSTWDVLLEDGSGGVGTINPRSMNPPYPDSDFVMSTTEPLPHRDFRGRLGSYSISAGAAYSIGNSLSIGLSPIVTPAFLDVRIPSSDYSKMQADTGVVFQEGDFTGQSYGFNLGVLFWPNDRLSLGGNLKYQTAFAFEGDYTETVYKFYNEDLHNLALFLGDTLLSGEKLVKPTVRAEAEFARPLEFGFGAAYKIGERMLIALDFSYNYWSALDTLVLESADGARLLALPMLWVDTYRISIGGEYAFSRYLARLGAFYEPNPAIADYQNLFIPDVNDRVAFAGGFAAVLGKLLAEFSVETEFFGEIVAKPNFIDDFSVNILGEYAASVADFVLSVTYRF